LANDNKEVLALKKQLAKCKEIQSAELDKILPDVQQSLEIQSDSNVLYTIINSEYGISGLIGNKCLEIYNKPIFILKDCGDKYCGSMRSEGYGDFRKLCNDTGLAELHGHEEASGIEIKKNNLDDFIKAINTKLSTIEKTVTNNVDVDCEINLEDLTSLLVNKVKAINMVSGAGFKPLTFKVTGINEYGIGSFKQGKHLVITPSDNVQLIEWNTNVNYEELEDDALMNAPIEVVGELDAGFFSRKYMLKVIISDLKVGVA
jgi:single-stranded-DNA-specific exonuclease